MTIDSCFANTSAAKFTIAAAGRVVLSVSSALTPVLGAGVGGLTGKSCHVAQRLKRRERDPWVKFTLGQICVLNTS